MPDRRSPGAVAVADPRACGRRADVWVAVGWRRDLAFKSL